MCIFLYEYTARQRNTHASCQQIPQRSHVKAQPYSHLECTPEQDLITTIHCRVINKRSLFKGNLSFRSTFFPFFLPTFCTSWITLLKAIYFVVRRSITFRGPDEGIVMCYLIIKCSSWLIRFACV